MVAQRFWQFVKMRTDAGFGLKQPVVERGQAVCVRQLALTVFLAAPAQAHAIGFEHVLQPGELAHQQLLGLLGGRIERPAHHRQPLAQHRTQRLGFKTADIGQMQAGQPCHLLERQPFNAVECLARVVVAGHQSPELTFDQQRHAERTANAHVAQILDMHRMYGTQHGKGQIQRLVDIGRGIKLDVGAFRVGDNTLPVERIQTPRVCRNIVGGKAQPQKPLHAGLAALVYDLAVPVLEKTINHDAVVAGTVGNGRGEHASHVFGRVGVRQTIDEVDTRRFVPPFGVCNRRRLELQHVILASAMGHGRDRCGEFDLADTVATRAFSQSFEFRPGRAEHRRRRTTEHRIRRIAEPFRNISRTVVHPAGVDMHRHESAQRLQRADQMQIALFTVGDHGGVHTDLGKRGCNSQAKSSKVCRAARAAAAASSREPRQRNAAHKRRHSAGDTNEVDQKPGRCATTTAAGERANEAAMTRCPNWAPSMTYRTPR